MTRGGRRKGAGRKPMSDKKRAYSTKLRPDHIEWLKANKPAGKHIEIALDEYISRLLKTDTEVLEFPTKKKQG